jgi:hypothetical protein
MDVLDEELLKVLGKDQMDVIQLEKIKHLQNKG